jgi:hypothetical protein
VQNRRRNIDDSRALELPSRTNRRSIREEDAVIAMAARFAGEEDQVLGMARIDLVDPC